MNILLFYFDKFTAWLDFSWLITRPLAMPPTYKENMNMNNIINEQPPNNATATDPLLQN